MAFNETIKSMENGQEAGRSPAVYVESYTDNKGKHRNRLTDEGRARLNTLWQVWDKDQLIRADDKELNEAIKRAAAKDARIMGALGDDTLKQLTEKFYRGKVYAERRRQYLETHQDDEIGQLTRKAAEAFKVSLPTMAGEMMKLRRELKTEARQYKHETITDIEKGEADSVAAQSERLLAISLLGWLEQHKVPEGIKNISDLAQLTLGEQQKKTEGLIADYQKAIWEEKFKQDEARAAAITTGTPQEIPPPVKPESNLHRNWQRAKNGIMIFLGLLGLKSSIPGNIQAEVQKADQQKPGETFTWHREKGGEPDFIIKTNSGQGSKETGGGVPQPTAAPEIGSAEKKKQFELQGPKGKIDFRENFEVEFPDRAPYLAQSSVNTYHDHIPGVWGALFEDWKTNPYLTGIVDEPTNRTAIFCHTGVTRSRGEMPCNRILTIKEGEKIRISQNGVDVWLEVVRVTTKTVDELGQANWAPEDTNAPMQINLQQIGLSEIEELSGVDIIGCGSQDEPKNFDLRTIVSTRIVKDEVIPGINDKYIDLGTFTQEAAAEEDLQKIIETAKVANSYKPENGILPGTLIKGTTAYREADKETRRNYDSALDSIINPSTNFNNGVECIGWNAFRIHDDHDPRYLGGYDVEGPGMIVPEAVKQSADMAGVNRWDKWVYGDSRAIANYINGGEVIVKWGTGAITQSGHDAGHTLYVEMVKTDEQGNKHFLISQANDPKNPGKVTIKDYTEDEFRKMWGKNSALIERPGVAPEVAGQ